SHIPHSRTTRPSGNPSVEMKKAVFLDRDGVLNRALERNGELVPPRNLAEFELLPGVRDACESLRNAGFLLIVVTNQPDVARGTLDRSVVGEINRLIREALPLDDIRVCYHDDGDHCDCRKPKPGLLLQAAKDWDIDLAQSFLVGDRWKDIAAARNAGCRAVMVANGCPQSRDLSASPDARVHSLKEAGDWILRSPFHEGALAK
ncbi:MAG TPA: HAD family hydrolase, partial [Terriglobales bacterium]|nr:HAD family hydrolase [Terriglobales bacterium]